jgi:hypothetical protein
MIPEPASRGSCRSVLKDIDDLTPFEVDNDCSLVVSLPGGPIVDAHHANGMACPIHGRPPLQMAQDGVGATGDAHPPKQPLARQAAGRMAGRVDQCLDLVSDPREWPRNAIKSFGEGYAPTAPIQTSKPSDSRMEGHPVRPASANPESDDGRCCGRSPTVSRILDIGTDQPARSRASTRPHYVRWSPSTGQGSGPTKRDFGSQQAYLVRLPQKSDQSAE